LRGQFAPKPPTCVEGQHDCSCDELADTTGGSDAFLRNAGELLGTDDAGHLGHLALAEDLEVALFQIVYYLIKQKLTALVTSITTAFFSVEALRASSDTRVKSLSRFTVGQKYWFLYRWKCLCPFLPK